MTAARRGDLGAIALAAAAAFSLAGEGARAQAPAAGAAPDPQVEYLPDEGTLRPRRLEIVGSAGWSVDWSNGAAHVRAGPAVEVVPWIPRSVQSLRFSVYHAALFGTWGDDQHDFATHEAGAKLRLSFWPTEPVDLYAILSGGFMISAGEELHTGVHTGLGGGIRVFRAITAELSFDHLIALDDAFEHDGRRSHVALGFGTSVGFDFCSLSSWCDYPALQQQRDDRTCCIYDDARSLCSSAQEGARRTLCAAVDEALDARRYPLLPDEESFEGFLRAVALVLRHEPPEPASRGPAAPPSEAELALAVAVDKLRARDERFDAWREEGRRIARAAANLSEPRVVLVRRVYAPYPVELRRALGCGREPGALLECSDVCDSRPSDPAACHTPPVVR
ncbi:MAG: hypothetical protein IT372_16540 [Polyangiaceae bacterium]|nr:hypothetical protein [Polyangiaceae bacterium]